MAYNTEAVNSTIDYSQNTSKLKVVGAPKTGGSLTRLSNGTKDSTKRSGTTGGTVGNLTLI